SEEYALLQYLECHTGTTLQPDEIAAAVWGENVMLLPDAVESLAAMLYVKLAACDACRPSPWRVGAPTPCGHRAAEHRPPVMRAVGRWLRMRVTLSSCTLWSTLATTWGCRSSRK